MSELIRRSAIRRWWAWEHRRPETFKRWGARWRRRHQDKQAEHQTLKHFGQYRWRQKINRVEMPGRRHRTMHTTCMARCAGRIAKRGPYRQIMAF